MYPMETNQKQQAYGIANAATCAVSESEVILERLRTLRSKLTEVQGMSHAANEKIIGPAPEKLQHAGGIVGQPVPAPQGFLHIASNMISDIDIIASEIAEQLSRLHRSF